MKMQSNGVFFHMVLLILLVASAASAPVLPNEIDDAKSKDEHGKRKDEELGLEYERYLKQIIEYLEEDEQFRNKLGSAKMEDITSGRIANELQFVDHRIRTRLDELKRRELHRLRQASKQENELAHGVYPNNDPDVLGIDRRRLAMPLHVDARNPHTFEIEDLKKLVVQTTKDLEDIDRKRKEDFKHYEMEKEHKRRQELQKLDEAHRKQAEEEHDEQLKRHREHPRLHHPGSKQQLEEVWEKEDKLPTEEFDPLTFFQMHDLDGNGHWDEEEVKSLFRQELNKMYDQNNTDDDMLERIEEMDRMREHVVNETDTNKDGLISVHEFLEMTKKNEFNQDPGWEGLDEQQLYDENEFREFERQYQAGMIPPGAVYVPGGVPQTQYQHIPDTGHPQMAQPIYPSHLGYDQVAPGQYQYQQQVPQYQAGVPQAQYQHYQPVQQGYPNVHPQQQYQGYQPEMQQQNLHPGMQLPSGQQYQGMPAQSGPQQGQLPQVQGGLPRGQQPQQGVPAQGGLPQGQLPQQGVPVQGGLPQGQLPQQGVPGGQQHPPSTVVQNEHKAPSSEKAQIVQGQSETPKSQ